MQWNFLLYKVLEILSVMSPFNKVHTSQPRSKWITPEIFAMIRKRKFLIKQYRDLMIKPFYVKSGYLEIELMLR